jgi:hypothetical protein
MPLPPWSEVWDAIRLLIVPAFATSLLLMLLGRRFSGERSAVIAPALALAAGVLAGNCLREAMPWRIDSDHPLNEHELRTVLGWSLEGKPAVEPSAADPEREEPPEQPPVPPARYWLPWLAGLALLIDLLARLVSPSGGWAARTAVALLAGRLLTPADLRIDAPWASWTLGLAILWEWAILRSLARLWRDGSVPAALSLCFAAAGLIILHAHSARLTDMALLFSVPLFAIALVAWIWPVDTGGALSAAAVFLPGLLLNAQQETFSQAPWRSFLFAALAPIALLPLLYPKLARLTGWKRWALAIILPAIPATWGLILAAQAEQLQF